MTRAISFDYCFNVITVADMKTTRHELLKVDANGSETFVWFTPTGNTVSVYTWAPHTDYTNRFIETVEVARASWRDLLSRGFKFVRTFQSDPPQALPDPDMYG